MWSGWAEEGSPLDSEGPPPRCSAGTGGQWCKAAHGNKQLWLNRTVFCHHDGRDVCRCIGLSVFPPFLFVLCVCVCVCVCVCGSFFSPLAHDGHRSLGGQVQHEPRNLFKILLHHTRKMSETHGGGTAHGAAEDETKLWFWFSWNVGFKLWAWMMHWTSSHGWGFLFVPFFFFCCCCCLILSIHPPPAFSSFGLFCFLSLSLFLPLSSPPFYSSSPPSPSALSVPFHLSLLRSLCLLKVSNKQTSSGWLESPIYNSSQSNYSKHVCQTHEEHLSVLQREREREKKYVLPSWLGHVTQRLSQHSTERLKCCLWHFCFVLIENTQGKGRDDGIGRTLWDQKFVKSKPLCFEGEIHLNAKFLTGFLIKNKFCSFVNCMKMSALSIPSRRQPDESEAECMRVCFLQEDLLFSQPQSFSVLLKDTDAAAWQ